MICHGDLHPFNLLVDGDGDITVIDWTAAIRAEPVYDVAFTAHAARQPTARRSGPARRGHPSGSVPDSLTGSWLATAPSLPTTTSRHLDWYRALHGSRILVEAATLEARHGPGVGHPFQALVPAASSALRAITGTPVAAQS